MIADIEELDNAVKNSIFYLFKTFAKSPGMFWSEADVESYLYSILINEPVFKKCLPNFKCEDLQKKSVTTLVHSQAKVYPKRMGKRITDIAIVIPNKWIEHQNTESVIGIEIKFNRKRPAARNEKASIMNDIKKVSDNKKGYVLLLNWDRSINSEHLDAVIKNCNKCSNVDFFYIDISSGVTKSNFPKALT